MSPSVWSARVFSSAVFVTMSAVSTATLKSPHSKRFARFQWLEQERRRACPQPQIFIVLPSIILSFGYKCGGKDRMIEDRMMNVFLN